MRKIAFIMESEQIERIIQHLITKKRAQLGIDEGA
jgi:hypothetical protein